MTDPMLAKAKMIERALFAATGNIEAGLDIVTEADVDLMNKAALVIQQMRVRLEYLGEDDEPGGLPPQQAAEMAAALGRAAFKRIDAEMMGNASTEPREG